jgi:lysophospholipase L1-like esterase
MNLLKHILSLFICLTVFSCSYDFPEKYEYSTEDLGAINLEEPVFAGDDYMAGLMDGALYNQGQQNSVASIISSQFKFVSETEIVQPEINSENGLNLYTSFQNEIVGKWVYEFLETSGDVPQLKLTKGEQIPDFKGDINQLNDLSVPVLRMNQVNSTEFTSNPFFKRITSSPVHSYTTEVVMRNPTFVILWLGMNDILDYAIHGAVGNPDFDENSAGSGWNMTSVENFRSNLNRLTDELLQNPDCNLVIGNLISIKSLPYFYIQPYNGLFLDNDELTKARAKYAGFNEAVAIYNRTVPEELKRPFIDFYDNGYNMSPQPMVVIDSLLSDAFYPDGSKLEKYRHLTQNEMVFYNVTDEMFEMGYGSSIPISTQHYLNEKDIELIEQRINDFNAVLAEMSNAQPERIVIADIKSLVEPVAETGKTDAWGSPVNKEVIYFDGVPVEGSLGINSIFSLDGLHFNPRGNAFAANGFIEAVNRGFGANFPLVDINKYIGNVYSFSF